MKPQHINPIEWQQAVGLARQNCARIFRDGGTPDDALRTFGLSTQASNDNENDWSATVTTIAHGFCNPSR